MSTPGRICPLRYRYGPRAIAEAQARGAQTLYVIGGLYGNVPALDAIEQMTRAETQPPTLCFNGDFNWFDVDDRAFAEINLRVLANDAILGNVEAELGAPLDDAGCGCAYPDSVDAGVVQRSNRIHAILKATARRHGGLLRRIAELPMVARYRVGDCRIGVVHGDAESLAGWRFDVGWSYFSCRLVRFALKTRCTTSTYVSSTFGRSVFFVQIGALRGWQPHADRALRFLAICRVRPLRSGRETPA